ncbi:MAG: hypothetical protein NVSMB2_21050 [Chloroflexota bacterium]
MSVSSMAVERRVLPQTAAHLPTLYTVGLVGWLVTRLLVLVHQGAWPWMNAFVVAAARGIVVGKWDDVVRPQLPAVLGVPLVLAGLTEQQTVAVLYVLASLVQFGAFVLFIRALYPGRSEPQAAALLVFLLVPFDHSIHHYRDVPVVLASSAVFLLAARFLTIVQRPRSLAMSLGDGAVILGATLLGVWSRTEVVTFSVALAVLALVVCRLAAVPLAAALVAAVAVIATGLLMVYRFAGVDVPEASLYQAHTFLDSTPESWLTPECRAAPTENCRERDGLTYFGPADLHAGVLPMVQAHPLATIAKTVRSAADNLWILLGPNLSTFPFIVPFLIVVLAASGPLRDALRTVPVAAWLVSLAVVAESVLPPLSWAPPHPQYHLQMVVPIVVLVVPVLTGLARMPRGRLVALAFLVGNAGLSALRYTRYPGY